MLYLEDYVELIEHLPSDLRERFTDMREMDLQVQNTVDLLNEKVKKLFHRCALKKSKSSSTDQMYEDIRKEYYKALENADVKVQLANKIYDLVDRHLRKLDQELSKFKMELEADNGGITEILEQRSLELDNPLRSRASDTHHLHKDRKRHIQTTGSSTSQAHAVLLSSAAASSDVASNDSIEAPPEKSLKLSVTVDPTDMLSQLNSDSCSPFSIFSQSPLKNLASDPMAGLVLASTSYSSLSQHADVVFGGSALNGGTSSVSQLFQPATELCDRSQLPLTANPSPTANNTKTNIDSVKQEPGTSSKQQKYEFDRVSVDSLDTSGEPCHSDSSLGPRPSRTKKQTSKAAAWEQQRLQAGARHGNRRKEQADASEEHSTEAGESSSWNYDPNEPRYCICNQVSYGEMVGCDNQKCPIEWFHYGCVGVSEAPKGKWYCPQCTQTMKRRNRNRC